MIDSEYNQFDINKPYFPNDIVVKDGFVQVARYKLIPGVAENANPENWHNMYDEAVRAEIRAMQESLAKLRRYVHKFDPSRSYHKDSYTFFTGRLFKANNDMPAWTPFAIGTEGLTWELHPGFKHTFDLKE